MWFVIIFTLENWLFVQKITQKVSKSNFYRLPLMYHQKIDFQSDCRSFFLEKVPIFAILCGWKLPENSWNRYFLKFFVWKSDFADYFQSDFQLFQTKKFRISPIFFDFPAISSPKVPIFLLCAPYHASINGTFSSILNEWSCSTGPYLWYNPTNFRHHSGLFVPTALSNTQ